MGIKISCVQCTTAAVSCIQFQYTRAVWMGIKVSCFQFQYTTAAASCVQFQCTRAICMGTYTECPNSKNDNTCYSYYWRWRAGRIRNYITLSGPTQQKVSVSLTVLQRYNYFAQIILLNLYCNCFELLRAVSSTNYLLIDSSLPDCATTALGTCGVCSPPIHRGSWRRPWRRLRETWTLHSPSWSRSLTPPHSNHHR